MVEVCDVSAFWLLWIMLLLTFVCTFLFKHLFSIVLSLHPGVELPGHMVTLCLTYWGTVFSFLDFLLKEASTHVISFLNGSRPSGVGAGIFGIRVFWGDMDILPSVTAATGRESCMRCCPRGDPALYCRLWNCGHSRTDTPSSGLSGQFLVVQPKGDISSLIVSSAASA